MAEVQYAPASLDGYYGSPRRHNSETSFSSTYVPRTQLQYSSHLPSSAPSSISNSPPPSSSSLSTQSSYASSNTDASHSSFDIDDEIMLPDFGYGKATVMEIEDIDTTSSTTSSDATFDAPAVPSPTTLDPIGRPETPDAPPLIDDIFVRPEPSRHVDYLSHDWKEEDIWTSWRYMIGKRKYYHNAARLENASWRTWAKAKNNLKTVSPAKLNWLKDCDVTWLYGPLSTYTDVYVASVSPPSPSEPQNRGDRPFLRNTKKTILKKRSMSEVMLQRSLSSNNLIKQAAASIQSQSQQSLLHSGARPTLPSRTVSDYASYPLASAASSTVESTSGMLSTEPSGIQSPSCAKKHIHFNDRVEQCIAVDAKEEDDDPLEDIVEDTDDSSDDGLFLAMKPRARGSARSSARNSFSEPQTIAMLPATTLKAVAEASELKSSTSGNNLASFFSGSGPKSPTTMPGAASSFLLNDEEEDDEELDIGWKPSGAFANRRDSVALNRSKFGEYDCEDDYGGYAECPPTPPSGNEGIFGKAVDAVNTARDIAQVFWNVWPRR